MSDAFDLLGLAPTIDLRQEVLDQAYFNAQLKAHPDVSENADVSLLRLFNESYGQLKTLKGRAACLLKRHGISSEELVASPDAAYLERVFELSEAGVEALEVELSGHQRDLYNSLKEENFARSVEAFRRFHVVERLIHHKEKHTHVSSFTD